MNDIRNILKKNLIAYSKDRKITQKELSELLGVTQSAVSHWFKGDNSPNIEVVARIAEILSVPMSALLSEADIYDTESIPNVAQKNSPGMDESAPRDIFTTIEHQYDSDARQAFSMYAQLDQGDQGEIRGEMKHMLKADKYKSAPCLKGESAEAV